MKPAKLMGNPITAKKVSLVRVARANNKSPIPKMANFGSNPDGTSSGLVTAQL
jgi:hypothetical protein